MNDGTDDDSSELEFKDVPIFNRSNLAEEKPFRYAVKLNCTGKSAGSAAPEAEQQPHPYAKLLAKLEALSKEEQNDPDFSADLLTFINSLVSSSGKVVGEVDDAEEPVIYVDGALLSDKDVEELNKKFGDSAQLDKFFVQLRNVLKEQKGDDLLDDLERLSVWLKHNGDVRETVAATTALPPVLDSISFIYSNLFN